MSLAFYTYDGTTFSPVTSTPWSFPAINGGTVTANYTTSPSALLTLSYSGDISQYGTSTIIYLKYSGNTITTNTDVPEFTYAYSTGSAFSMLALCRALDSSGVDQGSCGTPNGENPETVSQNFEGEFGTPLQNDWYIKLTINSTEVLENNDPAQITQFFINPDELPASTNTPCFLAPTRLLTIHPETLEEEYKAISEIKKGDKVKGPISSKAITVTRCGSSDVNLDLLAKYNFPRHISKDFFAPNKPSEDVYLSGGHRLLCLLPSSGEKGDYIRLPCGSISELDEHEIKSSEKILEITKENSVKYYHIELEDTNEGVIAGGLAVESLEAGAWDSGKFTDNE